MSLQLHDRVSNIVQAVKLGDARVILGDCWLVWDEHFQNYVIYQKKYRQRESRIVLETKDEEIAARELVRLHNDLVSA